MEYINKCIHCYEPSKNVSGPNMWGDAKIASKQWHRSWYLCPQQRTSSNIHPNNGSMLWSTHTHFFACGGMTYEFVRRHLLCHRSCFVSSPCLFVTGLSFSSILSRLDLLCSVSRWCAKFRVLPSASEASSVVVGLPRLWVERMPSSLTWLVVVHHVVKIKGWVQLDWWQSASIK